MKTFKLCTKFKKLLTKGLEMATFNIKSNGKDIKVRNLKLGSLYPI